MKTKTFFVILIGLVMTINTIQAQMYVMGTLDPSNTGNIGFTIDYRESDTLNYMDILIDSTGQNKWTCIEKIPANAVFYIIANPTFYTSFMFVVGKDSSNILHYTTQNTFEFNISDSIELKTRTEEVISDDIKESFFIKSKYEIMGYTLFKDSIPIIIFPDIQFSHKIDDMGGISVSWEGIEYQPGEQNKTKEFKLPILTDGEYTLEVYSYPNMNKYSKTFQIKRN